MHPNFKDDTCSNPSNAPTLRDVMHARLTRRAALKGLAATGATGAFGLFGCASNAQTGGGSSTAAGTSLTFTELGRFLDETHHVPTGYTAAPLLRWGDPLFKDAPPFDPSQQTPAAQERQFGNNNDFIAFKIGRAHV